jgi:DNA repair protein RadC
MIHVDSPPGTVPFVDVSLNVIRSMQVAGRDEVATLCYDLGLHNKAAEEVWVVCLDAARNIRAVVPVAKGGYHEVFVATPTIMSAVFITASDRFVLVHNHPSGDLTPTANDKTLTIAVAGAAKACDLMFEDHLIVGPPNKWYSMENAGFLRR